MRIDQHALCRMESGVVDATVLPGGKYIRQSKGYNELAFMGDIAQFPQTVLAAPSARSARTPTKFIAWCARRCVACCFSPIPRPDEVVQIVMKQHRSKTAHSPSRLLSYSQRGRH